MIRKSIIAVLLTCTIATGALWAASFWTNQRWHIGDQSMRHSRLHTSLYLRHGHAEVSVVLREEWEESLRYVGEGRWCPGVNSTPVLLGIRYDEIPSVIWRPRDAQDTSSPLDLASENVVSIGQDEVIIESQAKVLRLDENSPTWHTVTERVTYQLNQFSARTRNIFVTIPLWIPCVLFGIYPALALARAAFVRPRRGRNGVCRKCGYDLTGNISGVCPECGRGIAPLSRERREVELDLSRLSS